MFNTYFLLYSNPCLLQKVSKTNQKKKEKLQFDLEQTPNILIHFSSLCFSFMSYVVYVLITVFLLLCLISLTLENSMNCFRPPYSESPF